MPHVRFRFYEELNDFLSPRRRKCAFEVPLDRRASVKDWIESLGVPHPEVDLILVNSESVGFERILVGGDRVAVYPVFESLDIAPIQRLRPHPLRRSRFVLDVHLGRLARWLRLLGFDSLYANDLDDDAIETISVEQARILLTRDRQLLMRRSITRGYWVRATAPAIQVREVVDRLELHRGIQPFGRCMRCNGILQAVPKEAVIEQVPPRSRQVFDRFWRCSGCGRVYWKGSHFEQLQRRVDEWTDRI